MQRTKLLERTLEAGNHFTIIADRSQREDLAVELTEVYCNVRAKLKSTRIQRAVPWQEEITGNPMSSLKPTDSPAKVVEPEFVNA